MLRCDLRPSRSEAPRSTSCRSPSVTEVWANEACGPVSPSRPLDVCPTAPGRQPRRQGLGDWLQDERWRRHLASAWLDGTIGKNTAPRLYLRRTVTASVPERSWTRGAPKKACACAVATGAEKAGLADAAVKGLARSAARLRRVLTRSPARVPRWNRRAAGSGTDTSPPRAAGGARRGGGGGGVGGRLRSGDGERRHSPEELEPSKCGSGSESCGEEQCAPSAGRCPLPFGRRLQKAPASTGAVQCSLDLHTSKRQGHKFHAAEKETPAHNYRKGTSLNLRLEPKWLTKMTNKSQNGAPVLPGLGNASGRHYIVIFCCAFVGEMFLWDVFVLIVSGLGTWNRRAPHTNENAILL